jgi:hypothetical protein
MKRIFIILLSMSLCTFAEAQKALEWQVKIGIYTDVHSLPEIRDGIEWQRGGPKYFVTGSIGLEINKWKTLIQINTDSRLTIWNKNVNW